MKGIQRYMFIAIILVSAYLIFLILKPYLLSVLTSFLLAYLLYPLYKKVNGYIKRDRLSSLLIIILALVVLIVPSFFVVNSLVAEANDAYRTTRNVLLDADFSDNCTNKSVICNVMNDLESYTDNARAVYVTTELMGQFRDMAVRLSSAFLMSVPRFFLNLFIIFFLLYYLLKDGERLVKLVKDNIPGDPNNREKIVFRFKEVTNGVVFGSVLTALIQGIIAGIGYFVLGITSPIILGLLTMVAALFPYVGTAIVWVPISAYLIIMGLVTQDTTGLLKGVALSVYGVLIISTVDNFVRPLLIGDRGKVHPAIVLLGILGGISLWGFIGIFLGPLLLSLLITFIQVYGCEFKHGFEN